MITKTKTALSQKFFVALLLIASLLLSNAYAAIWSNNVSAADLSKFNVGNIIDDAVFYNYSTMSTDEIQIFLNSKVSNCTSGYTCLKNYSAPTSAKSIDAYCSGYSALGSQTAAQIIYGVSQSCKINPRVLLVLLQKETGLVTHTGPGDWRYQTAVGMGCPDTAVCDSQYYGLFNQLYGAARQYRIYQAAPNNYRYIAGRNNSIQWSPSVSCGASTVYIENQATAGLYNYTPYQPNTAAVNAGYGNGDGCSSYGNRNFFLYFTDWFGSTRGSDYAGSIIESNLYYDEALTSQIMPSSNGNVYSISPGRVVYAKVVAKNTSRATWTRGITNIGTINPNDHTSVFSSSTWINSLGNRAATAMENSDIAPNGTATFKFQIKTPNSFGHYTDSFGIVVDGKSWIESTSFSLSINVPKQFSDGGTRLQPQTLGADDTLKPGQSIYSNEGHSILRLSNSGNLELWVNYQKVWSTNTDGSMANKFINQGDGNLVLYRDNTPVWASNTRTEVGGTLSLQSDSNLVLYQSGSAVWASNTVVSDQSNLVNNLGLMTNQVIFPGQYLSTPDRYYKLFVQTDGNIVLYTPTRAIWASNTFGQKIDRLTLQSDGNAVAYNSSGKAVWASNTFMSQSSYLIIQQDGNVVMYNSSGKAVWASNTFMVR